MKHMKRSEIKAKSILFAILVTCASAGRCDTTTGTTTGTGTTTSGTTTSGTTSGMTNTGTTTTVKDYWGLGCGTASNAQIIANFTAYIQANCPSLDPAKMDPKRYTVTIDPGSSLAGGLCGGTLCAPWSATADITVAACCSANPCPAMAHEFSHAMTCFAYGSFPSKCQNLGNEIVASQAGLIACQQLSNPEDARAACYYSGEQHVPLACAAYKTASCDVTVDPYKTICGW